jgi:hypothetical protein
VGAKSTGRVKFEAVCNPPAPNTNPPCTNGGDQADLALTATLSDVRNAGVLTDYIGELRVAVPARKTDSLNGSYYSAPVFPGTTADFILAFNMSCAGTSDQAVGSTCSAATTADAVMPALVRESEREVWTLGRVQVYDGGGDGDADTAGDNTLFMEQGLFVP